MARHRGMGSFADPGEPIPRGFTDPDLEGVHDTLNRGRGGGPRGFGPGPAPRPGITVQVPPPDLVLYPQGSSLYARGDATINNGASAVVCTVTVPANHVGIINSWTIFGVNLVVGLDATWSLEIDGSVPQGAARGVPPQTAASGGAGWGPDEILFRIPEGSTARVIVNVVAGGPMRLGSQISGWHHPATLAELYAAAWT